MIVMSAMRESFIFRFCSFLVQVASARAGLLFDASDLRL
jgi:hypothetical protein